MTPTRAESKAQTQDQVEHRAADAARPPGPTFESWFPFRRPAAGPELFAFPHVGAGPSLFNPLRAALRERGLALAGALPPGRGRRVRERPHAAMDAFVAEFEEVSRRDGFAAFCGEYCLVGHSSGALAAFEIARMLLRSPCRAPRALVLCSCLPPPLVGDSGISRLPGPEVLARTVALGGTAPAVLADRDFVEMMTPTLRADWAVLDGYADPADGPLPVPILAVRGSRDTTVPAEDLERWKAQTSREFETAEVEADHWVLTPEGSARLAELIPDFLARLP
jgi:surfactin synthase thioesterase subunit